MENYRTTLEYYNSYIIKRFLLNFCNNYFSIFYLALAKVTIILQYSFTINNNNLFRENFLRILVIWNNTLST